MKLFTTALFGGLVASSLFIGCISSNDESTTNSTTEETTSTAGTELQELPTEGAPIPAAEVKADLTNIAKAVKSFALQSASDKKQSTTTTATQRVVTAESPLEEDGMENGGMECEHTTIDTFKDEHGVSNDTTSYFSVAGAKITSCDAFTQETVVMKSNSSFKGSLYNSSFQMELKMSLPQIDFSNPESTEGLSEDSFQISMEGNGKGKVEYNGFGIKLDIYSAKFSVNNEGETITYLLSMMDGKYRVRLHSQFTNAQMKEDAPIDPKKVLVEGPITDKSGAKVGVFQLMEDEKVNLIDLGGKAF